MMMPPSGGDASVLTCEPEHFHDHSNQDQIASMASKVLQATPRDLVLAMTSLSCPIMVSRTPISGTTVDWHHSGSYASDSTELHFAISDDQMRELLEMVNKMVFGGKDP